MKKEEIKRIMKRRSLKEQGITLVALVVTIIILLILAWVTLNIALSENGLFQRAKGTAKRYENASENETEVLDNLDKTLAELSGEPSTGGNGDTPINRGDLKVGDTVDYTPKTDNSSYTLLGSQSGYGTYSSSNPKTLDTPTNQTISQETYTWRVLSIDDIGNVEIVGVPTSSNTGVYFQGALGYNNGVYLLDDICNKLYSNKTLGITARSIDIEDIQKGMSSKGITENTPSGEVQTYTGSNAYYPELYKYQKDSGVDVESGGKLKEDGISESDATANGITIPINTGDTVTSQGYTQTTNLTVKSTNLYKSQVSDYYNDEAFFNMMFPSGVSYWFASRYSLCNPNNANFGLRNVNNGALNYISLFNSGGDSYDYNDRVCPVVFLGSNIQLTKNDSGSWTPSK